MEIFHPATTTHTNTKQKHEVAIRFLEQPRTPTQREPHILTVCCAGGVGGDGILSATNAPPPTATISTHPWGTGTCLDGAGGHVETEWSWDGREQTKSIFLATGRGFCERKTAATLFEMRMVGGGGCKGRCRPGLI